MPRKRTTTEKDIPEDKQIFRCWVEVLDLKTGLRRELPLKGVKKIYIPRKKNDPGRPDEDIIQLKDGLKTLEAKDRDDLVAQLRQKYPDDAYERRLFMVRDREAEKRRADALDGLTQIIAEVVVEEMMSEGTARSPPPEGQPTGPDA